MASRLPIVRKSGKFQELPSGDFVPATAIGAGTVSDAEFARLVGVTSGIQAQLDAKQALLGDVYRRITADQAIANNTSAQNFFSSTPAVTVEAAAYWFEMQFALTKASNNAAFNFGMIAGSAAIASMDYWNDGIPNQVDGTGSTSRGGGFFRTAAMTQLAGGAAGNTECSGIAKGIIVFSGAGTVTPQYQSPSIAWGVGALLLRNSYVRLTKLEANPQGTWT